MTTDGAGQQETLNLERNIHNEGHTYITCNAWMLYIVMSCGVSCHEVMVRVGLAHVLRELTERHRYVFV